MLNDYAIDPSQSNWINWLLRISDLKPKLKRVHDYSQATYGTDYIFDVSSTRSSEGYMTSQMGGVNMGDFVLLMQDGITRMYQIQSLDYYSSPNNMWIARLTKLDK